MKPSEWKDPEAELPEDRGEPYQVIAAQRKQQGGVYAGTYKRVFTQDWHVRQWPDHFVAWQYDCVGQFFGHENG